MMATSKPLLTSIMKIVFVGNIEVRCSYSTQRSCRFKISSY